MPIGALINAGIGLIGASQQSAAADEANKRAEERVELQYEYDKKNWKYNKKRLKADRQFAIEGIELQQREDAKLKGLKDAQSLDNYGFNLKIRQQQMDSYTKQYSKSRSLYDMQANFNSMAMTTARIAEQEKMNDAMAAAAFQNEDLYIQGLQEQGMAMASGQSGKSAGKTRNSIAAQLGRNQNIVLQNLLSSKSEMRSNLAQIATQTKGAAIQNFGNLMIPQNAPPEVLEPYETLVPEYQMPRELKKFDFGPEPVKGVANVTSTSAPWLNALGSVSSSLITAFSNNGPNLSYGGGFGGGSSGGSFSGMGSSFNLGGFGNLSAGPAFGTTF